MILMTWRRRVAALTLRKGETGSATMEFALLTPMLLLMVIGTGDFGRVFFHSIAVAQAARAGAQYGAQSKTKAADVAGITAVAQNEVDDLGVKVTANRICQCGEGMPVSCTDVCTAPDPRPEVYLSVTVEHTFRTAVTYPGLPNVVELRRTAILRVD